MTMLGRPHWVQVSPAIAELCPLCGGRAEQSSSPGGRVRAAVHVLAHDNGCGGAAAGFASETLALRWGLLAVELCRERLCGEVVELGE